MNINNVFSVDENCYLNSAKKCLQLHVLIFKCTDLRKCACGRKFFSVGGGEEKDFNSSTRISS